jgi:hypothetical protein
MNGRHLQEMKISFIFTNYKCEELIKKNIEIIEKLNQLINVNYFIINNDIDSKIKKQYFTNTNVFVIDNPSNLSGEIFENASYHHASAINYGLSIIDAEIIIIIDSDFFIIQRDWIKELVKIFLNDQIVFFGAPYYPKYFSKYKYFPCAHFMAINLNKVEKKRLNFTPNLKSYNRIQKIIGFLNLPLGIEKIFLVGKSKDTGFNVYKNFSKTKYISLVPYFEIKISNLLKFYSKIVPDKFSIYPKKKESYTSMRYFTPNLNKENSEWEEYYYKDKLYSLHMRLGGKLLQNNTLINEYFNQIDNIINNKF